jgi:hypothetical protein
VQVCNGFAAGVAPSGREGEYDGNEGVCYNDTGDYQCKEPSKESRLAIPTRNRGQSSCFVRRCMTD